MKNLIALFFLFGTSLALAELTLDPGTSRLNFVSIKNGQVAELHRFTKLSGSVDDQGKLAVEVALNSVDTRIEIRDERMREMLFETQQFPVATYTAKVDTSGLDDMVVGEIQQQTVEGELNFHGQTAPLTLVVRISRTPTDSLVVSTVEPAFIKVGDFGLLAGIDKLREVAGLDSIAGAVPITFYAVFRQAESEEGKEEGFLEKLL